MNIAIIIAGGTGHRFGADIPKQFVTVNNEPVIWYTLRIFQDAKCIDRIVLVCAKEWEDFIKKLKSTHQLSKLTDIVKSGDTRFNSIYNGIFFCCSQYDKQDTLIIHDAVRPCITEELLENNINMARLHGAALAAAPCFDTMFIISNGKLAEGIYPREKLCKGQTPISIKAELAAECYQKAVDYQLNIDSPAALLLQLGKKVALSKGSQQNIKITTKEDLKILDSPGFGEHIIDNMHPL